MLTKITCFYCGHGRYYRSHYVHFLGRAGWIYNCYNCSNVFFGSIVNNNEVIEMVDEGEMVDLYKDFESF